MFSPRDSKPLSQIPPHSDLPETGEEHHGVVSAPPILKPRASVARKPLYNAIFPELVDVVADKNGRPVYLIDINGRIATAQQFIIEGTTCYPPPLKKLPFKLSSAEKVLQYIESKVDSRQLLLDTIDYLGRFSALSYGQRLTIAMIVFASYIQDHRGIRYIPILLFHAVPERGKTRSAKAILSIAYRGIHLTDMREANVFRLTEYLAATLCFDISNFFTKCEKNQSTDIALGPFEKGLVATRVKFPEKEAFDDVALYNIFGPTIIATNEAIDATLKSRCIVIEMENSPRPFEAITKSTGLELKSRFIAWRGLNRHKPLPNFEEIEGVTGRLRDIAKPLVQICSMIYPEGLPQLYQFIREQAAERREMMAETLEGRIIEAICEICRDETDQEFQLLTKQINEKVNQGLTNKVSAQLLGRRLNSMGLRTRTGAKGYSYTRINMGELEIFRRQYLPESAPIREVGQSQQTQPHSTFEGDKPENVGCNEGEEAFQSQPQQPEIATNIIVTGNGPFRSPVTGKKILRRYPAVARATEEPCEAEHCYDL